MQVVSLEHIPSGDEVTSSYLVSAFHTTLQRRALLARGKCFECDCARCADPAELGSYASAIRCTLCDDKEQFLLPEDPLSAGSPWRCPGCELVLPAGRAIELDNRLVSEIARVNRASPANLEKFLG